MKSGPGSYAGIVSRGIAFAVDGGIVLFVCTVGFQFAVALFAVVGVDVTAQDASGAIGYLFAVPVVFIMYCTGFWTLVARTPGMMLLGLRVVDVDGGSPGARRALVRALGYWVSAIACIGFLWIAVDERRQGFHDKLAGTFIVYDWLPAKGSIS